MPGSKRERRRRVRPIITFQAGCSSTHFLFINFTLTGTALPFRLFLRRPCLSPQQVGRTHQSRACLNPERPSFSKSRDPRDDAEPVYEYRRRRISLEHAHRSKDHYRFCRSAVVSANSCRWDHFAEYIAGGNMGPRWVRCYAPIYAEPCSQPSGQYGIGYSTSSSTTFPSIKYAVGSQQIRQTRSARPSRPCLPERPHKPPPIDGAITVQ